MSRPPYKHSPGLYLPALILLGLLVLAPFHDFHPPLASGDNGRDLYAFAQTRTGALPYRDYSWVYGPLMPYYYALFLQVLGVSIKSVLIGHLLLRMAAGVFLALILKQAGLSRWGWGAALWFWAFNPRFSYTYSHAGGVACILGLIYVCFLYLNEPKRFHIITGLLLSFFLGLIKLNIGLAGLAAFSGCVVLIDRFVHKTNIRAKCLLIRAGLITAGTALVYTGLLSPLPAYAVRQCLPYLAPDRASHVALPAALFLLVRHYLTPLSKPGPNLIFALIILTAWVRLTQRLFNPVPDDRRGRKRLFYLAVVLIFWAVYLHEFFISAVPYRLFWVTPLQILLIFLVLGLGFETLSSKVQTLLRTGLLTIVLVAHLSLYYYIRPFKTSGQYLASPRGRVYVANSAEWVATVHETVRFLNTQLAATETFLALPYDPLYYFLSEKTAPVRQLFFHAYIDMPSLQEKKIISEIEKKNVRYILISNRAHAAIPELGIFGKTYAPLLFQYIQSHFELIQTFGEWKIPGRAFKDHAVRIYKRHE